MQRLQQEKNDTENVNPKIQNLTGKGERKRAKTVDSVLNHITEQK